ncbi:MAG: hypothetical protein NTV01_09790 [Bacteroidia bacterium]|nr:hypothetical protein [Bacteroidia bacterium]
MGSLIQSEKCDQFGVMTLPRLIFLALLVLSLFGCDRENKVPDCNFTVEPSSGNLATIFYFDGSPTQDKDNLPYSLLYRWDYNSDQIWDSYYSHDPKGAYKFSKSARYNITLEVKDPQGNIAQTSVIVVVTDEHQPPVAEMHILPPRATTGTTVILDASQSSDDMDDTNDLLFRWDVYGDGL